MSRGAEVIVAGAGVLGLSAALALADAGCSVTVCDPQDQPSASAVAAGMLAPVFEAILDPGAGVDLDLLFAARDLWPALAGRAGIEIDRSGALAVAADAWLAMIAAGLVRLGVPALDIPRDVIDSLAPGLSADLARGLLVREDWRVDAEPALDALRRAAAAAGVTFRRERVIAPPTAGWLVVATGGDQALAASVPELAGLSPIKGQIIRFPEAVGGRVSLRAEGAYAVPGAGGLAIGATMEVGVSDARVDPAKLKPLVEAAARLFPHLASAPFRAAAGVRATTVDGLPLVGRSETPRVLLAAGARRNGWLLAPLVARVIVAQVTGADAGAYAARLDPARFAVARSDGVGT